MKKKPDNWYYDTENDEVVFQFDNQPDERVDRSEFNSEPRFMQPISEDDEVPFTPTEQQYKEAEKEFWDKYHN
jgi:hypothetical protein